MLRSLNAALDEPASYEELYAAHHGQVIRLCRLLLADRQEAEDVAQEVFLKMFREHQTLASTQPMVWGAWLTRVSVNACRDRRRSRWWKWWRMTKEEYQEAIYPSPESTPEEALLSRETQGQIWRAFRGLSGRQQEIFLLRQLEGWSTDEVADFLQMSTGAVKQHLFRAVQNLRRKLGEHS